MGALYLRHGLPVFLRSDNGTQFVNRVVDQLNGLLGVRRHRVLAYSPQSNGHVERANQEVTRHLRTLVMDLHVMYDEWPKLLPLVQHIMNHSVHSQLGFTPHAMLYGDLVFPMDRVLHKLVPSVAAAGSPPAVKGGRGTRGDD